MTYRDPPWAAAFTLAFAFAVGLLVRGTEATPELAKRVHAQVAMECFARWDPDVWNTFMALLPDAVRRDPTKLARVVYKLPAALATRPLCPSLVSLTGGAATFEDCRAFLPDRAQQLLQPMDELSKCLRGVKRAAGAALLASRDEEEALAANAAVLDAAAQGQSQWPQPQTQ